MKKMNLIVASFIALPLLAPNISFANYSCSLKIGVDTAIDDSVDSTAYMLDASGKKLKNITVPEDTGLEKAVTLNSDVFKAEIQSHVTNWMPNSSETVVIPEVEMRLSMKVDKGMVTTVQSFSPSNMPTTDAYRRKLDTQVMELKLDISALPELRNRLGNQYNSCDQDSGSKPQCYANFIYFTCKVQR